MDDLQLNISVSKKDTKKASAPQKNASDYKFVSNAKFTGKTIARKRPQNLAQKNLSVINNAHGPPAKVQKVSAPREEKSNDLSAKLRDLSENKGKFHGKNYQDLSDNLQLKQKPRSGGWISSLFKNNPQVPRMGQRAVKPIVEQVFAGQTFSDLDIHPHCVANLQQNLGLKELMTVQQNAVPVILQGRDVLIRSQTGSGKTLAYALPIIEGLQAIRPKINRHDGIRVVVVVPTRELAMQTYELFVKLVKPFMWIVPGLLSGGQKRKAEKARLRKGLSILVGTPGRINDHLRHTQSLNFAKIGCLVLDEADRLLDMGYEKDVAAIVKAIEDHKKAATYDPMAMVKQNIVKKIPAEDETEEAEPNESENTDETTEKKHHLTEVFLSKEKQTILLSATLTKAVENLAGITLVNPVFVDTSEGKAVIADSLKPKKIHDSPKKEIKSKPEVKAPEKPIVVMKEKDEDKEEDDEEEDDDEEEEDDEEEKDDEEADDDEDDDEDDDDDDDDDNEDDEDEEDEEEEKKEKSKIQENNLVEVKRGLKAFIGLNHPELFKTDSENPEAKKVDVTNNYVEDDSDSDSDYEYFKVQKQLAAKNPKVEVEKGSDNDDSDDEEESNEVAPVNTFAEAVKSALVEDELVLPASVNQTFLIVPMKLRLVTLCSLIVEHCVNNKKGGKMIVFMATLEMVDYLSELIEKVLTGQDVKVKKKKQDSGKAKKRKADNNDENESSDDSDEFQIDYEDPSEGGLIAVDIEMFSLHGSMPHERRMEVFKQFRTTRSGVLFCTDVAARGVDIPRVDLVLQYCAPTSVTDYVHRIGRTGRAAQVGAAVMFLLPSEAQFIRLLEEKRIRLRQKDESQALEALRTVAPASTSAQRAAVAVQARLEKTAHTNKDWLLRASRAYTSWVRFYSGYPRDVREYLDSKKLHLGHAAKAFALRDAPATLARRVKSNPSNDKDRPTNRLTVHEDDEKKRPGFGKVKIGSFSGRQISRDSSMHTASEFDSGLPPLENAQHKKQKKK